MAPLPPPNDSPWFWAALILLILVVCGLLLVATGHLGG